jgi:hypothetical protein
VDNIPKKPPPKKEEANGVEKGIGKGKRAREDDEDDGTFRKKPRVAEDSMENIIVIEDDDTILID